MAEKTVNVTVQEQSESTQVAPADQGFFSWIQDDECKQKSIKKARTIPWLGIGALAGSAATALLSMTILLVVDGRETWPNKGIYKFMQPASWLSALISANSIFLHIALTQGVTVAWWYKATRANTTVGDLHKTWATGTSAASAISELRGLDYISLATLFVAIIPLNGFLLQGALSTPVSTLYKNATIEVPMVKRLQLGYSAYTTANNTAFGSYKDTVWPTVFQQVQNTAGSLYSQYAYLGNTNEDTDDQSTYLSDLYHNDTTSYWQARVPGAGFEYTCSNSTAPFDLLPRGSDNVTAQIFNSKFSFNRSDPNVLHLNIWWKNTGECTGVYQVRNCTLRAATVEYPVQVQLNVSHPYDGPYYSLEPTTTRHDDKLVKVLDVYPEEGVRNSTFGGIFNSFNSWFGGSITLSNYTNTTGGKLNTVGQLGEGANPGYSDWFSSPSYACNISLQYGLMDLGYFQSLNSLTPKRDVNKGWLYYWDSLDVADIILEQVRTSMFLASVYSGSQWWSSNYIPFQLLSNNNDWLVPNPVKGDYIQNVEATRIRHVPTYEVRWYLWGASIALTYLIILVVLPTFWGFWVLIRKPTMSPVDMARAFSAPAVSSDVDHMQMPVDQLLKQVGNKKIHGFLKTDTD